MPLTALSWEIALLVLFSVLINDMDSETEGTSIPGSVQGRGGWAFEQPGLIEDVPSYGSDVGARRSLKSLPAQTVL